MANYMEVLEDFHGRLLVGDATVIGIVVAVVVVLFTILLFVCRGSTNKRRGVLLVGLCDSGKTLIYSRLVLKKYTNTHTSVRENSGDYKAGDQGKQLRVVDLPGYERLRNRYLDEYKSQARGIAFVVDSVTFNKDIKEVGEYLYTLLTDSVLSQNAPPIVIVCNKQDQTLAKGAQIVRANLERELNTVRKTKSAALQGTDNTSNNNTFLGRTDRDFTFSDLKHVRTEFIECSARGTKEGSDSDLSALKQWLDKLA